MALNPTDSTTVLIDCNNREATAIDGLDGKLDQLIAELMLDPRVNAAGLASDAVDSFSLFLDVADPAEVTEIVRAALDDADLTEVDFTVAR